MSQADLARSLTLRGQRVSKQAVSHWINGRYEPPLKSAPFRFALAASLDMDTNEMMNHIGYVQADSQRSSEALRAADMVDRLSAQGKVLALEHLEVLERHFGKTT